MHHKAKILSYFLLIVLFFIQAFPLPAQKFTSLPDCNCSVRIPGNFKSYIDTFTTDIGKLIYHTYTLTDSVLNYQLSFLDYPEGSVHSDSTDLLIDFFSSTIEASVESVKGVKKYQAEIKQFEYPGYLWKIEFGRNQFMKSKAFVAGSRFYTLQVFGDQKYDKSNMDIVFFDSFRFLNPNLINR